MSLVQSFAALMPCGFGAKIAAISTLPVFTRKCEQFSHTQPPCMSVETITAGNALVSRSDLFVRNVTVKLLTYALGRGVEYYDMPVVRNIDREAARNNNTLFAIVQGIVKSVPFDMRRAEETMPASSGANQQIR